MSKGTFGIGMIIGSLVGYSAAHMLSPKTGEEMQAELLDRTEEMRRRILIYRNLVQDQAHLVFSKLDEVRRQDSIDDETAKYVEDHYDLGKDTTTLVDEDVEYKREDMFKENDPHL
ncbi:YtxH domain-containing protein [Lacticigenium naphthae]|uniref:YtxH domain-containing protein n=1 Tax=Lacticigenium naphthae TaxID=515351 RepID=UPI000426485B|nr:YtxH domain-containing protein [Lacticigenium naphthae]